MDFGPTVRFYGDDYFGNSPDLSTFAQPGVKAERYLAQDWRGTDDFTMSVMVPLAAGGSVVVVTGSVSDERLQEISAAENVTRRIQ